MKILAILVEFPFPPNHGYRCDAGRRLQGFAKIGWDVHAVTWTGGRLEGDIRPQDLAEMQRHVSHLDLLPLNRGLRRIWNMRRWPSQAAGRWPSRSERKRLLAHARSAKPSFDAVWIDGIHAAPLGRWLARELGLPYFYRSHNVETRYIAEQAGLARGKERVSVGANLIGLRKLELETLAQATLFFDISEPDLAYWRSQGFGNGRLLSTLADQSMLQLARDGTSETISSDIAFAGSLALPNNLAGLDWYLSDVHPKVIEEVPQAKLLLAGRNPPPALVERVSEAGGTVLANPERMEPILLGCKVAINPILHGSGVNIKMIDMLASGRPVVTTRKGARGLPREIVDLVAVADSAEEMALAIVNLLNNPDTPTERTKGLDTVARHFGLEGFQRSLAEAETIANPTP